MSPDDEVFDRLSKLEERVARLESKLTEPEGVRSKSRGQSVAEFIRATSPASVVEKTLVIGYFLEHFEGVNPFNARDVESAFRRAKEPPPANVNEAINKNIRKGLVMEAAEKKDGLKAWMLTNSGDSRVVELKRSSAS